MSSKHFQFVHFFLSAQPYSINFANTPLISSTILGETAAVRAGLVGEGPHPGRGVDPGPHPRPAPGQSLHLGGDDEGTGAQTRIRSETKKQMEKEAGNGPSKKQPKSCISYGISSENFIFPSFVN